jgi:predicted GNAT family N-acyltransferase
MPSKIEVKKISNPADLEKAFSIRHEVFVKGQNCPAGLERANEEESHHFLVTVDGETAGASRWRKTSDGYKLERFAVLSKFRGQGVGQALVKAVLADLPADAGYIYLNSQLPAVTLYEKFGFQKTGPQFEEAGIQHFKMVKNQT